MAGEVGRFTALIGADAQGLTSGLRGGARSIEQFVKDTQRRFAQIGVGPDFGRAGAKAGKELIAALKGELDNARPLLKQFAESVNIDNRSAVGVIRQLVAEHERLAKAAGASGDELREIAAITRLIDDRELAGAATALRRIEDNADVAERELRGLASALRAAGASSTDLNTISRQIGEFSSGTGFTSTRVQSLERLRATEISLQRALQSGQATLTQRIQLERELARTSSAIADAQRQTLGSALGFGDATRRNERSTNTLTSALGRQIIAYASLRGVIQGLRGAFEATDEQERAARRLSATARLTGESFATITGFAKAAQDELKVTDAVAADLVGQLAKLTSRAQQTATTGQVLIRWLDLAAANGLTLDETLQTIQTTLIGQDEGLNRLGLSNPAQIYERWAKASGTAASRMSDAQKAQAILAAVVEAGTKVQGEYNKALDSASGRQQTFTLELDRTKAALGRSLASQRQFATEGATGLLAMLRTLIQVNDEIERMPEKWFRLMGGLITGGASGFARELIEAQRELDAAVEKAAKDREAAQRRFNQGPPAPRAPVKVTVEDNTKAIGEELRVLKQLHDASALRGSDLIRIRELDQSLTQAINSGLASKERLAELLSIRTDVRSLLDTSKAVSELTARVDALVVAYGLASNEAGKQEGIAQRLLIGYDALTRALAGQKDQASAISNELTQQLATLKAFDPVLVGLARRQFKGVDSIPTLEVPATATITDIRIPELNRQRLFVSLGGVISELKIPISVAKDAAKQLPPIPLDFDMRDFGSSLQREVQKLRGAQNQRVFADLFGGKEQQIAATKSLSVITGNLGRVFKAEAAAILQSADSAEIKRRKLLELKAAAEALGIPIRGLTDDFKNTSTDADAFAQSIRSVAGTVRGLLGVADAFDAIGDSARRQLTAIVGVVEATANLVEATGKGATQGGVAGAIIAASVSAASLITSIISAPIQESKANREIMKSNNQVIARLSQDLQGFAQTPGQLLRASRAVSENAILNARALTSGFTRGFKNIEELDRQLRASGSSIADLKRRAEELGISIVDAKGRITTEGLFALNEAMKLHAERMVRFSKSFEDQSSAAALRRRVLGEGGPDAIFRDSIAIFRDVAPRLFDQFFQGIDVSTKEGRESFRRKLVAFVDDFIAGVIPVADFGELDKNTIIRIVNEWLDATEEMTKATKEAAGSMINLASGFAVSKRAFQAITAGLNAQSSTQTLQRLASQPPTVVPLPETRTTGAQSVTVNVDIGGIVAGGAATTGAQRYRDIRTTALNQAKTISQEAVAAVLAAFPPL